LKGILTSILAIGCIAVLILGSQHWREKTSSIVEQTPAKSIGQQNDNTPSDPALNLAANFPEKSLAKLQEALEDKKPFTIHIVGSNALGEGPESWPILVKEKVEEAYGDIVKVTTEQYDLTSLQFVQQNKQKDIIDASPDMIIFEPFILKDNGEVTVEDSLQNLTTIMDDVKEANPETAFVIQPAHPLYNSTFYPNQKENLQQYAEENKIPYLDHWEKWPNLTDRQLLEYLSEDNNQPSPKGHKVWAEFVTDYLISK
jgi:hypothetical protein